MAILNTFPTHTVIYEWRLVYNTFNYRITFSKRYLKQSTYTLHQQVTEFTKLFTCDSAVSET